MKRVAIDSGRLDAFIGGMPQDTLSELRRAAADRFKARGFPDPSMEDWKYTPMTRAAELSNTWLSTASKPAAESAALPADLAAIDANWIVIRNGHVDLGTFEKCSGVEARLLSSVEPPGNTLYQDNALSQLNLALLRNALLLDIEEHTAPDRPVGILIIDDAGDQATVSQHRVVVNAAAHSRAQIIEVHRSTGVAEQYANGVVELSLAPNSKLELLRIQQRARHHVQSIQCRASLECDATLIHAGFDLGGSLIRNDLVVSLAGAGASVDMHGLYLAGDRQHVDNHTRVDHRVGPSFSNELYRGILNRRARCIFNGKAVVHEGADGTDARQANNNLLLSGDAEIDTKPELEIYADDVKCSHGATVGQLDANALFYLRTRGLDEETATSLMTRAFAAEILGLNPVHRASDFLADAVQTRLDTLIGNDQHD